ncbi:dna cytosine-5-methyltransferase 3b-like protein, partial [Lasius niger]
MDTWMVLEFFDFVREWCARGHGSGTGASRFGVADSDYVRGKGFTWETALPILWRGAGGTSCCGGERAARPKGDAASIAAIDAVVASSPIFSLTSFTVK